ncbi:TIGR00730 family Rossman fold protein [Candidatus Roizmanbacteria bacterium]|nr:TIGR00730 family Rossman fold protein [Candidatus Roizmanbacteria bacterium]
MIKNAVVFGGANGSKKYLDLAYDLGRVLAKNGFVTVTGGGPGMMHEVNRGAFEAGGESIGIRINHTEQISIEFFTSHEMHDKFQARHDALLKRGDAFVALPGGLGTILEIVDITQRKKFKEIAVEVPLILISNYFKPLLNVFHEIAQEGFIREDLEEMYQYAKNPQEVVNILKKNSSLRG